jgi:hypothetical protein
MTKGTSISYVTILSLTKLLTEILNELSPFLVPVFTVTNMLIIVGKSNEIRRLGPRLGLKHNSKSFAISLLYTT